MHGQDGKQLHATKFNQNGQSQYCKNSQSSCTYTHRWAGNFSLPWPAPEFNQSHFSISKPKHNSCKLQEHWLPPPARSTLTCRRRDREASSTLELWEREDGKITTEVAVCIGSRSLRTDTISLSLLTHGVGSHHLSSPWWLTRRQGAESLQISLCPLSSAEAAKPKASCGDGCGAHSLRFIMDFSSHITIHITHVTNTFEMNQVHKNMQAWLP